MSDLKANPETLLKKLKKKEKVILSFRGKPIATIHPIVEEEWEEDIFYKFLQTMAKENISKNSRSRKL